MLRALKHLIETRFNKGQVKQNTHKSCSFLIVSLSKSLSLCFMCSDQHVKHWIAGGFPLTSSLLLDYHVKITHTYTGNSCISFRTVLTILQLEIFYCERFQVFIFLIIRLIVLRQIISCKSNLFVNRFLQLVGRHIQPDIYR